MKKEKQKTGRKPYWDTRVKPRIEEIKAWCMEGHTEKSMCKALGISIPTFIKYKRDHVELFNAVKVNKAIADQTVENSLYKKANGWEYDEETIEIKMNNDNEVVSKVKKVVKKVVPPSDTAMIFWLKNRKKEQWRDKQHIENNVNVEQKDTRTTEEVMLELGVPIPKLTSHTINDMPEVTPTETPETPLQRQAPPTDQSVEIARLKAQIASQEKLIKSLNDKDDMKPTSTDDPESIVSPFGK